MLLSAISSIPYANTTHLIMDVLHHVYKKCELTVDLQQIINVTFLTQIIKQRNTIYK